MLSTKWYSKAAVVGVVIGLFGPVALLMHPYVYKEGVDNSLLSQAAFWLNYPAVWVLFVLKVETEVISWLILAVVPVLLWIALAELFFFALHGLKMNRPKKEPQ